jgi:hypothetical protein
MDNLIVFNLRIFRKLYKAIFGLYERNELLSYNFENQDASDLIKKRISDAGSLMVARLGATELKSIVRYYWNNYDKNKKSNYVKGKIGPYWWDKNENIAGLSVLSGFFPSTPANLDLFCELMLDDIKEIDILGSWLPNELVISDYLRQSLKVPLRDLEPYYHVNPWSQVLQGKKVLVVHPFTKSIENQYKNHDLLFENKMVLPDFELKTIKAVQSIAGNKPEGFNSWFDALDFMKKQISDTKFDIAIIGCGAYGLPLAAHVKRMGKKAIHLGGQTQVMFGIKGKRWEDRDFFLKMFNEHWIRPLPEETPYGYEVVEDGCYW